MSESKKLVKEIEDLNWAHRYLRYVDLLNTGLRKQARIELIEFFNDFNLQSKNIRRNFINIVNKISFITNESDVYLPYDMYHNLFLPAIDKWINDEPLNPIPYKWSNKFEDNKKALELDSKDQITIEKISNHIIGKVSMNQHEIENGYSYDGNPNEDILLIDFVIPFVQNLEEVIKRVEIIKTLKELKDCAINQRTF
jgi:hypothetical protein